MTNFIFGFLIGVIAEFIAKRVQKRRDKEIILINGNGNDVKYQARR